jgi:hypothetical protein
MHLQTTAITAWPDWTNYKPSSDRNMLLSICRHHCQELHMTLLAATASSPCVLCCYCAGVLSVLAACGVVPSSNASAACVSCVSVLYWVRLTFGTAVSAADGLHHAPLQHIFCKCCCCSCLFAGLRWTLGLCVVCSCHVMLCASKALALALWPSTAPVRQQ